MCILQSCRTAARTTCGLFPTFQLFSYRVYIHVCIEYIYFRVEYIFPCRVYTYRIYIYIYIYTYVCIHTCMFWFYIHVYIYIYIYILTCGLFPTFQLLSFSRFCMFSVLRVRRYLLESRYFVFQNSNCYVYIICIYIYIYIYV